jgi:hypothetical protein
MLGGLAPFVLLRCFMKRKVRDNLIYLGVGVGVIALVYGQFVYSESHHGRVLVRVSTFTFRTMISMFVVGYFVARELWHASAGLREVILCVALAEMFQVVAFLGFHQYIAELSALSYVGLVTVETFLIVSLATQAVAYCKRRPHGQA